MEIIEYLKKFENRTFISYAWNFTFSVLKIILSISSKSVLIFLSAFYSFGVGYSKMTGVKADEKKHYIKAGYLVLISSVIYLVYSVYLLYVGKVTNYHKYVAFLLALISFVEVPVAIYGIYKAKKHKNLKNETLKWINLSTACISMALAQTAILSFTNNVDMTTFCAYGDIFFGLLSLGISVYMIKRTYHIHTDIE